MRPAQRAPAESDHRHDDRPVQQDSRPWAAVGASACTGPTRHAIQPFEPTCRGLGGSSRPRHGSIEVSSFSATGGLRSGTAYRCRPLHHASESSPWKAAGDDAGGRPASAARPYVLPLVAERYSPRRLLQQVTTACEPCRRRRGLPPPARSWRTCTRDGRGVTSSCCACRR